MRAFTWSINLVAFSNITLTSGYVKYYLTYTPLSQCNLYVRIISNTASTITWYVALVTVCMGDVHTYPEKSPEDAVRDAVLTKTFFAQTTVYSANQIIAQWTLERDLKIVNVKAYLITAVAGANLVVRLTNGTDNYDVTVSTGNNAGENTGDQEYSSADDMEVIIVGDISRTDGKDLMIVYQYRTS